MSSQHTEPQITLEDIAQMRQDKYNEITKQKEKMTATARSLFAPLEPVAGKWNMISRTFNTGFAVFDGAMMGLKIMHRIRHYFTQRKK